MPLAKRGGLQETYTVSNTICAVRDGKSMTISEALTKAVLLPYQKNWLSDTSVVKVWEKSRRIGASYVEALSCVMKAMLSKSDGGMNVGRQRTEGEKLSLVTALTSFPHGKRREKRI